MPAVHNPSLYVITGGPGGGETTLLLELESRGAACVPEVAPPRHPGQVQSNGDAAPQRLKPMLDVRLLHA